MYRNAYKNIHPNGTSTREVSRGVYEVQESFSEYKAYFRSYSDFVSQDRSSSWDESE